MREQGVATLTGTYYKTAAALLRAGPVKCQILAPGAQDAVALEALSRIFDCVTVMNADGLTDLGFV